MDIEILQFIGRRLHPSLVHFPIALFAITFLFDGIGFLRKEKGTAFHTAGRLNLLLGAFFAVLAAASGLWTEDAFHHPRHYPLVERHEPFGLASAALGLALCLWRFLDKGLSHSFAPHLNPPPQGGRKVSGEGETFFLFTNWRRFVYLSLLFVLILVVGYTAFLGGEIAHDY